MNIILFGPPGAGKGTQAKFIAQRYNLNHLSTGDILRDEIANDTSLGHEVKDIMAKGLFPSDDLIMDVLRNYLVSHHNESGFIFDGVPRTMNQVHKLDSILTQLNISIDHIIYFDVSEDQLIKRLMGRVVCSDCGTTYNEYFSKPKVEGICDKCHGTSLIKRSDDNEASIKTRLKVYLDKTQEVIDYYQKLNLLEKIDGSLFPEQVQAELISILDNNISIGLNSRV